MRRLSEKRVRAGERVNFLKLSEVCDVFERKFDEIFGTLDFVRLVQRVRYREIAYYVNVNPSGFGKPDKSFETVVSVRSRYFELDPGDDSEDVFVGDRSEIEKDCTARLRDIYKLAEIDKILKSYGL